MISNMNDAKSGRFQMWKICECGQSQKRAVSKMDGSKSERSLKWTVTNEWFQNGRSLMRMIAKVDGPEFDIFGKNESV